MRAFLRRPSKPAWPHLWLDATWSRLREGGRIFGRAAVAAVAVNEDGEREAPGLRAGHAEAGRLRTEFLRSLADRGLRG